MIASTYEMLDAEIAGQFAAIGIVQGKPCKPNARMQKILADAAAIANATARAITFASCDPTAKLWSGSQWGTAFLGGSYKWEQNGHRYLDAHTAFFYGGTVKHSGDGRGDAWRGLAIHHHDARQQGPLARRWQELSPARAGQGAGEGFLVGRGLRPANPFAAADGPALSKHQQRRQEGLRTVVTRCVWMGPHRERRVLVHDQAALVESAPQT